MPEIGDIAYGPNIGKKGRVKHIYSTCAYCGLARWVPLNYYNKRNGVVYCRENHCADKVRSKNIRDQKLNYWDGNGELEIGMVTRGDTVGLKGRGFVIYDKCPNCAKLFWRSLVSFGKLCSTCKNKKQYGSYRGPKNSQWKGGRFIDGRGYYMITLQPEDPFFSMTTGDSHRVLEHRLVMAKHLGRCLKTYECVHHINNIKTDNRIENLELIDAAHHQPYNVLNQHLNNLEKENEELRARVTLIEAELVIYRTQYGEIKTEGVK